MPQPTPNDDGSVLRRDALPLLGLFGLVVVVTWPLLLHIDHQVIGESMRPDYIGHIWHCRWFANSLFAGVSPYQVHTVLFPVGSADFIAKSGPCFGAALTVPLQTIFGVVTSYNITVLAFLALTAYAGYRLTHYLVRDRAAAFVAGALWLVVPLVHAEITASHVDQFSVGWCMLAVLYLLRTLREPGWGAPIALGAFVAITTLSYMGYALLLGTVAPLLLLGELLSKRSRPLRPLLQRIAISLVTFSVLIAPVMVGYLTHQGGGEASGATGVSFPYELSPSAASQLQMTEQIIYNESIQPLAPDIRYELDSRGLLSQLPVLLMALAALGVIAARRRAVLWAAGSACFIVLSLGPYFLGSAPSQAMGSGEPLFPLPGLLLYNHLPLFTRFRFPYRFLFMFWIFLSPLVAYGARALVRKAQLSKRPAAVGAVGLCAALLAESVVRGMVPLPAPLNELPHVPSFYSEILANEPDCAVLSIPFQLQKPTMAEEAAFPTLYWQSHVMHYHGVHGKRIVDGMWVAFSHPELHARFLERNTLLRNIRAWQTDPDRAPEPVDAGDLLAMEQIGFRYAIVHTDWLLPRQADSINRGLEVLYGPAQRYSADPRDREEGDIWVFDMTAVGSARRDTLRRSRIDLAGFDPAEGGTNDAEPPPSQEDLQAQHVRNPDDVLGWVSLASAYERRDEFGRALDALDEAATWVPDDARIPLRLGQLYEARGLPQLAMKAYRRAQALDPDTTIATEHLSLPAVVRPVR